MPQTPKGDLKHIIIVILNVVKNLFQILRFALNDSKNKPL